MEIQLPRPGQWLAGLCSRVSNPAGKLPSLPAARWARANSYTLKYAECKHPGCPRCPPPPSSCRGVTTPAWPDQWEVSPPSRPMGACHQALGQWEVSQCRDVPELRTNGRPQHPWCSTHDQPAPDMEKHGDKQANWFRPPRAKLNKYHFLLLFNLIT